MWMLLLLLCWLQEWGLGVRAAAPATPPSAPTPLEQFVQRNRIDPTNPPFTPTSSSHDPLYFAMMQTDTQRVALSQWVTGGSLGSTGNRFYSSTYPSHAKQLLAKITRRDVELCHSIDCCRFISDFLAIIPRTSLAALGTNCVLEIVSDALGSVAVRPRGLKLLEKLPDQVLTDNGDLIAQHLGDALPLVTTPVFQRILKDPTACGNFTVEAWRGIMVRPDLASHIPPACVEASGGKLSVGGSDENRQRARHLPATVFQGYRSTLAGTIVSTLSTDQIRNFASQLEDGQNPGGYVELTRLGADGARGLTLRLLLGFLYEDRGLPDEQGLSYLTANWKKHVWRAVPDDIFDKLTIEDAYIVAHALRYRASLEEGEGLRLSKMPHQSFLSQPQVEALVRYPVICAYLDPVLAERKVPLTRECFTSMPPLTQAAVLARGGPLADDALAETTSEDVNQWEVGEVMGLAVLGLASRRSNVGALIAHLGSEVGDDHPCGLLGGLSDLEKLPLLQQHMSMNCLQHLKFKIDEEDFDALGSRLLYLQPFFQLKRTKPESFWREMSAGTFTQVISNNLFCAQVDPETLSMIPPAAFASMTADCVSRLATLRSLPSKSVEAIPPAAFAKARVEQVDGEFLGSLSPAQLARLPPEILGVLTEQTFGGLSDQQIAALEAPQWTGIKPSLFATIATVERLRAIPPSAMRAWDRQQTHHIPPRILATLTKAQAEVIGTDVASPDASPLHSLAAVTMRDSSVQLVVDGRLAELGIARTTMSSLDLVLIGTGALAIFVVIGVGAFFFWSTRHQRAAATGESGLGPIEQGRISPES